MNILRKNHQTSWTLLAFIVASLLLNFSVQAQQVAAPLIRKIEPPNWWTAFTPEVMNGAGAICSLLTGFVLGTVRFVAEIFAAKGTEFSGVMLWLVKVNFLHYAIFMFVVCAIVLVVVSMMTPAPERRKLAGLTFATVDDKMDTIAVGGVPERKPARETAAEQRINLMFT